MSLEKKMGILSIITFILFSILHLNYLSESSIWHEFDGPAGIWEYIVSFIVLVIACIVDYGFMLAYAMQNSFTHAVVATVVTWPPKYFVYAMLMYFPRIFM